jgi:hypothetical protein
MKTIINIEAITKYIEATTKSNGVSSGSKPDFAICQKSLNAARRTK